MSVQLAELRLDLLGSPEVRLGDTLLVVPTRKTLALLIYLAVEKGQHRRDHLAAMFWPEATPKRSYASLRNTLGHLHAAIRQASGQSDPAYLIVTHPALALNPDAPISLDLDVIEHAYLLARSDRSSRTPQAEAASLPLLQAAAACYRDDFLVGFSLGDAPSFDDWVTNRREVVRRHLSLIFDRLSEIQFASGDLTGTTETASQWITLDALNEVAYRRKMRAHFAAGERGPALETFETCRIMLASELGVEPESDTQALAERIRTQHSPQYGVTQHHLDTPVTFLESLFAGRSEEHQALVDLYKLVLTGQPEMVVLRGEAGIGKTRLAREFVQWAVTQGAEVIKGSAFESGSLTLYQPLVEAIRPLFEQNSSLVEALGEVQLASLSQLLPELPGVSRTIKADQAHLFEALVRLMLGVSARAPLVLFIDDLQWSDRATLNWLVYAIRRWRESSAPILLLVALRSEALQSPTQPGAAALIEWLAQIGREVEPHPLELGPLTHQVTVQMVLSILNPPLQDFAEWIYSETRGHPFYLMETLKDLLERRALHPRQQAHGQWTFEVDAEHNLGHAVRVPSTVRAVIRSRLSRLSPGAFSLLAAAAILEQRLTFEYLARIANLSNDMALPALDELVSSRLLVEAEQPGLASIYAFANDMVRDVVYTEAGDARRRLFHQRALDLLEADRDSAAVLVHHATAAGLADAAFRHSLTAGQEALRLAAVNEAQAHLGKARALALEELAGSTEIQSRIQELYRQLAETYARNGQPDQAQAIYDELHLLPPHFPETPN